MSGAERGAACYRSVGCPKLARTTQYLTSRLIMGRDRVGPEKGEVKQSMDFLGRTPTSPGRLRTPWLSLPLALEMLLHRPGVCPLLGSRTVA